MRWICAAVLLSLPTFAQAQDAVTLKMPAQAKGDRRRVIYNTDQTVRLLRLDMFGNELKERASRVASQLAYVDDCLDADMGAVRCFRRRFENATETVNDAQPTFLAIHGKTLVVDRRKGTPQINWQDGTPMSDGITGPLEDAIKEGQDKLGIASFEPLPARPVKVGESWNIDVSAIVKDCEAKHGCKLSGATGVGTLKEIYQGKTGRCAKMEVHIAVPLRTIKSKERLMALNDGSGTTLDAQYDFALDPGDNDYSSTITMKFLATGRNPEADGTTTRVRMELAIDLKEQRSTPLPVSPTPKP